MSLTTTAGTIGEICRQIATGAATVAALAAAGNLDRASAWVGLKGAERYVRAVAGGDVAGPALRARRLATCAGCPAATPAAGGRILAGYCGEPLVDLTHAGVPVTERTCGCLLPAKASVASERCPRGRW